MDNLFENNTAAIASSAVKVFLEDAIETLKGCQENWGKYYVPETLPDPKEDPPNPKQGPSTDPDDVIYALSTEHGNGGFKLSFHERMSGLLKAEIGLDIEVVIGEEEEVFRAHKIMLANASPFFYSAIFGGLRKVKRLRIPDCKPNIFKVIIFYIYNKKYYPELTFELGMEALDCARKFGLTEFVDGIDALFSKLLSHNNVLDLLGSPYLLSNGRVALEEMCISLLKKETVEVLDANFEKINLKTLCQVLHYNNLRISEMDLFQFVYRWSKLECERAGLESTPENFRKVGKEAYELVRIPTISEADFKNAVAPTGVLTEQEVKKILEWKGSGRLNPDVPFSCLFRSGFLQLDQGSAYDRNVPRRRREFESIGIGGYNRRRRHIPLIGGSIMSDSEGGSSTTTDIEILSNEDDDGTESGQAESPEVELTREKLKRIIGLVEGIKKAGVPVLRDVTTFLVNYHKVMDGVPVCVRYQSWEFPDLDADMELD